MAEYRDDEFDARIDEAKKFLRLCNEADSNNRSEALEDLKFAAGDQWPVEIQNSRTLEARPCLTINKIDPYCRQVINNIRQQRPRIKAHGMNNESDEKLAQIITGITRHIEVQSDADQAYDNAVDYAVRMGWGYWRIVTDYVADDSFDQEIYIKQITNPFTVYFDPNSIAPDGSDAERCLITEVISKEAFHKMYPQADDGSGFYQRGTGDDDAEWVMREDIRIAEYFYTKRIKTNLLLLQDGTKVYEDEFEGSKAEIVSKRPTVKKEIHWCKLTGMEVLEEGVWAGKYIPVVPVYGQQFVVENKRKKYGLVRMAKDPQRMYNFWTTSFTESVALAPKAKWLMAEGQDEGHEAEWANANVQAYPLLRYKQKDIEGRDAPPPTRLQPEPPPDGIITALGSVNQDLMSVLGIFDPSQLDQGNISGKAINGQQQQADMSNFHFYDNLTRSIRWTGKIILDLIPKIYDSERVMRIIGEDGKPEIVTLNQKTVDEMGVEAILNDVTVGQYDVVMETGPGFNSKRQEAVASMMPLLSSNEQLFQIAGDLVFRNMDFPGADVIADRLAAANPLAQIDEKSDIPPQIQMQLAQAQKLLQEKDQQIQALALDIKHSATVKQMQEEGATKRKLMDVTAKAHDTETVTEQRREDSQLDNETRYEIEQLKAYVAILMNHMNGQAEKVADAEAIERAI